MTLSSKETTFCSLAILKVDLDEGRRDYIGYFENFVVHLLSTKRPSPVTDAEISKMFEEEFGLKLPERAAQLVLRRLVKQGYLVREHGVYEICGELPKVDLSSKRSAAIENINRVYKGLKRFAQEKFELQWGDVDVTEALLSFLGTFAVDCLRAYVFNTALPEMPNSLPKNQYVVGRYISQLHHDKHEDYECVIILVKGQMFSNALICPDLEGLEKDFQVVTFYLDTSVVLSALDLQGIEKYESISSILELIKRLRGTIAVFAHTLNEVDTILSFAEHNIDNVQISNPVLIEIRQAGLKRGDITLLRERIPEKLKEIGVLPRSTPKYIKDFQISESEMEEALQRGVGYQNPRALAHDINSVRSIYALREGSVPKRLEDTTAVLVTTNNLFSKAAFEVGKTHNSTKEVSSVITDYSLANVAWLKAPLEAPDLPTKELMAACYAAMEPSRSLWDRYLTELDAMKAAGTLTPDDHALLRVSGVAVDELMNLTLGDEEALTRQLIPKVLARVKAELSKEHETIMAGVTQAHEKTQREKQSLERSRDFTRTRFRQASRVLAYVVTGFLSIFALFVLVSGAAASTNWTGAWFQNSPILASVFNFGVGAAAIWAVVNWICGLTFIELYRRIKNWFEVRILAQLNKWFLDESGD